MFAPFILALLAFSSLTAAADPGCDELFKPLEDQTKIYGRWIFHVAATDSKEHLKVLNISKSAWVRNSPLPGSAEIVMHYMKKIDGKCISGSVPSTTVGNTMKLVYQYNSISFERTGRYLETCPNCVLWMDEAMIRVDGVAKETKNLYLLTKTEILDASHLEVFKNQAKCLNLLQDLYFSDTTDLCPDELESVGNRDIKEL